MAEILDVIGKNAGFYGIAIFGLSFALLMMWRRNNHLNDKLIDLQELRVTEAKAIAEELTKTAQASSKVLQETNTVLNATHTSVNEANSSIAALKDLILMGRVK